MSNTVEAFGGDSRNWSEDEARRFGDFWHPENLRRLFLEENKKIAESGKHDSSAWQAPDTFLVRLWIAVDELLKIAGSRQTEQEQWTRLKSVFRADLQNVFPEIAHGNLSIERKLELAEKLWLWGKQLGQPRDLLPEGIDKLANESGIRSLAELKSSLKKPPEEWMRRDENFSAGQDLSKISPITARVLAEDLARLRERYESNKPGARTSRESGKRGKREDTGDEGEAAGV